MYDFLIVGAGLFGSIFANEAKKKGYKCLVIDKRSHIGGNCYTEKIEGIDVHKYGPHIFNTNNKEVWDYIRQFSEFNNYTHRAKAFYSGKYYSLPVNLSTFYDFWSEGSPQDVKEIIRFYKETHKDPQNFEEYLKSQIGSKIYYALFHGYTKKQWNRDPKTLPIEIAKRIPIRLTFDDNYYNSKYQGIPVDGYTKIFEKLLEGIEVRLNTDYWEFKDDLSCKKVVYTGPIDELYAYCYGVLGYRSLKFDHQILDIDNYQGTSIINYPSEKIPYTRITEHKHFTGIQTEKTIISYEYPEDFTDPEEQIPYYPINDEENNKVYKMYKEIADNESVIIGGRLAEYKYYNMDQVIASALECARREL